MRNPTWPTPTPPPRARVRRRRGGWTLGIMAVLIALSAGFYGGYQFFTHKNQLASLISPQRQTASTGQTVPVYNAMTPGNAHDVGALNPTQQLTLTITLPLSNQARLKALLANQYNPQSPFYHRFLTADQFRQDYGPSTATISQVTDLLIKSGLKVINTNSWQYLTIQAPVKTVESVFHVQLHQFSIADAAGVAQTYYGPLTNPQVDQTLAGLVQNVSGLDNFARYHTAPLQPRATANGYTPTDMQRAYGADTLQSQGITGKGQTIAFVELAGYDPADISAFQQQYGVSGSGTITTVPVDGVDPNPTNSLQAGSIEAELDLEVAAGMAPDANQLVYIGPNSTQGINDIYSQIINDHKAQTVSISWGLCESATGKAELQTLDQLFQQGASEGMAFFAAAGDDGAYDCGNTSLGVDSPADDPYVTGVGGTTLTLNNGGYGSEKAWSCTSAQCLRNAAKGAGGGGGLSGFFQEPAFQQGLSPKGAGGASRFVPDVSANADPQTGYAIYCTVAQASCPGSGNLVVGGTSAAAPLWAAGAALIDQYLSQQTQPATLGNANPALYAVARAQSGAFHDVTSGTNLKYAAGPGYDLASGWGSPNFATLATSVAAQPTGTTPGGPNPTPVPVTNPTATPTGGNPPPTTGNPTATPVPPVTNNGQELLINGDFEQGPTSDWQEQSAGHYELIDNAHPYQGAYSADFCGYVNCDDLIGQVVQLPTSFNSVSLSYYWQIVTDKQRASCADTFTVSIYQVDASGTATPVQQVQSSCNSDASNTWQHQQSDVTAALQNLAGQDVLVVFEATTNGSQASSRFFVDNVSMTVG